MKNDIAYANVDFIPDGASYPDRWAEAARGYRDLEAAVGRARLNVPYGDHEREKFDLFHPAGPASGLVVFVHGGYWLRFDRSFWSHFARGARDAGWCVAMPSYPLAPEARIAAITGAIGRAVETAAAMVRGPIRLAGHSAGGHLVARMICENTPLSAGTLDRIVRVVPISPVADLRPLIETSMNADFGLDAASAAAESPALMAAHPVPTDIWVGGDERPVFLDQARWLAKAWDHAGLTIVPGRHHFDVIDGLEEAGSPLMQSLLG